MSYRCSSSPRPTPAAVAMMIIEVDTDQWRSNNTGLCCQRPIASSRQRRRPVSHLTPITTARIRKEFAYSQNTRRGRFRASTARAFLSQVRRRPNLRVETGALVCRLTFADRRCTGIEFRQGPRTLRATAAREVIVSAGTIGSPHLLQISGIGAPGHLHTIGVPVVHALPSVGRNLSDHLATLVVHRLRDLVSINQLSRGGLLVLEGLRYLVTGRGAFTFGVTTAIVFAKSREGLESPDLQLSFTPMSRGPDRHGVDQLESTPGASIAVQVVQPDSRGSILARSADPNEYPVIRPNYFSAQRDLDAMVAGLRVARRIFAAPSWNVHSDGEARPGPNVTTDAELADYARATGGTVFHPVGTCRMGGDEASVVDSRLRVRGVGNLRIIDASIMPTVTTGNTNAPTIMIAEKGAAMIREDARLDRASAIGDRQDEAQEVRPALGAQSAAH